ncbi:hypothetical protein DL96DRAFT_1582632 [Flagelloscypha sp. PMI_526]|nr:hypothetical protein DL96DRAFT_1582632 [Flagelloscypha sp. PMI_526]
MHAMAAGGGDPRFPALYLYSLNDSFTAKHIALPPGQHVKIGRQTNAKTTPGERNGYFDSKVLSRQHAEVWSAPTSSDEHKIYIKDVKSSNGTFINGERLSQEGAESEPFELHSDDIVEFGIDIVGEDNKTVIHHKVAARVFCVFNETDAQVAARGEVHTQQQHLQGPAGPQVQPSFTPQSQPNGAGSSFNFAPTNPQQQAGQRRQMNHSLQGMGSMGGSMRPPGSNKSGLTFEHIVSRLQGEIQKSRETGAELHTLTGAMGEVRDTLGGLLVVLNRYLKPDSDAHPIPSTSSPTSASGTAAESSLAELQTQLATTQSSLSTHLERIHVIEDTLKEHENVKREVDHMREILESKMRSFANSNDRARFEDEEEDALDDDDDARSISTIIPHELDRVDEEDESLPEDVAASGHDDEEVDPDSSEARRREQPIGRPHTPEPNGMGLSLGHSNSHLSSPLIDDLTSRLSALASQLESALSLSESLQAQHTAAQSTISLLESKVEKLEELVNVKTAPPPPPVALPVPVAQPSPTAPESREEMSELKTILNDWKKSVEGQWSDVRDEWKVERERLSKAREEFESKSREYELRTSTATWVQSNVSPNHQKRNGLVTPPSPRSLSADSSRDRRRRRRSSRGRSRSGSRSSRDGADTDATLASVETDTTKVDKDRSSGSTLANSITGLVTPEASLRGSVPSSLEGDSEAQKKDSGHTPTTGKTGQLSGSLAANNVNVQTAVGVVVLSIAAAAVIWRVKPGGTTV